MRLASAVLRITNDTEKNTNQMLSYMDEAKGRDAGLILFPEAALTGLALTDDYQTDKTLACSVSSPRISKILDRAAHRGLWTVFGFLENAGGVIYDSALLIDDTGRIVIHYRRISPGWKAPEADPREYGDGRVLPAADTPWGKATILVCGDLFGEANKLASDIKPDLLLFPFARSFPSRVKDPQATWDSEEWPDYADNVKSVGAFTLMSNYISAPEPWGAYFGGGFAVSGDGRLLDALPLNREGLLLCDMDHRQGCIR